MFSEEEKEGKKDKYGLFPLYLWKHNI